MLIVDLFVLIKDLAILWMAGEFPLTLTLLVILLGALFVGYLAKVLSRPKNFPPGPRGLPILGYAPFLALKDFRNPSRALAIVAEQWGPVCGFWLGTQPTVILSSHKAVKEGLSDEKLMGRQQFDILKYQSPRHKFEGLFNGNGPGWAEQRRFFMRHLRDLGFGKGRAEQMTSEEVNDFLNYLEESASETSDRSVVFGKQLKIPTVNVLWAILAGKRLERDDERFFQLLEGLENASRATGMVFSILIAFPWLRHIIPEMSGWNTYSRGISKLQCFVQDSIDEHRNGRKDEQTDFIYLYLEELDRRKTTDNDEGECGFNESQLVTSIIDMFSAGVDTTSNSIGFILLTLVHHQEVQNQVHAEIDSVVGRERLPAINDRINLPYTSAVILEVQRLSTVAPLTIPHFALEDTTVQGYHIPKGTVVHNLLRSVHMEKSNWGDPEVFRPNRFLEDGKLKNSDHLIPFSQGRRSCMGESLAKMALFLFTSAILQKYKLLPSPDMPLPTTDDVLPGILLAHRPFKVILQKR